MTKKEAEAIEQAIMMAVASAVGAAIAMPGHPASEGGLSKEWTNDDIRARVREHPAKAIDK